MTWNKNFAIVPQFKAYSISPQYLSFIYLDFDIWWTRKDVKEMGETHMNCFFMSIVKCEDINSQLRHMDSLLLWIQFQIRLCTMTPEWNKLHQSPPRPPESAPPTRAPQDDSALPMRALPETFVLHYTPLQWGAVDRRLIVQWAKQRESTFECFHWLSPFCCRKQSSITHWTQFATEYPLVRRSFSRYILTTSYLCLTLKPGREMVPQTIKQSCRTI